MGVQILRYTQGIGGVQLVPKKRIWRYANHLYTWIHNNASSDFPLLDSTALRLDDLDGKPILSRAGSGVGH